MKEFIEYILNQIVTNPEAVVVEEIDQNGFLTYQVEVAQEDMGLVIGKSGKTINSIRSLVRAKAIKEGVRVRVELLDKENPREVMTEEVHNEDSPIEEPIAEETVEE